MDRVACWLPRAQGSPDLAKQVACPWEPQLPRCSRRRTPPHPPRPSASPTQVTQNLGLPRPPPQVPQAPSRNAVVSPGQEPHWAATGFPKTKAVYPRPARCPGSPLRPLGVRGPAGAAPGRAIAWREQGPPALHPTPGGVSPKDHRAQGPLLPRRSGQGQPEGG